MPNAFTANRNEVVSFFGGGDGPAQEVMLYSKQYFHDEYQTKNIHSMMIFTKGKKWMDGETLLRKRISKVCKPNSS